MGCGHRGRRNRRPVVRLNVEVGENLSQGELIVALNQDTAQTRLDMTRAEMARAKVTMSQAEREYTPAPCHGAQADRSRSWFGGGLLCI